MTSLIKKLSIALIAGVVLAVGFVSSASALTGTLSVTTFTALTQTPAMIATATAPSTNFTDIRIHTQQNVGSYPYFTLKGSCPPSGPTSSTATWSLCGINDIQVGGVSMTSSAKVGNDGSGYLKITFSPAATTGAITIDFAAGAFSAGASVGNYEFFLDALDNGTNVGTYTQIVNVLGANQTVTFDGNGADGGSTAAQTANSNTALTLNGFTRTGYTFGGWATSAANATAGTVYKTDGALYSFAASRTLYAIWNVNSGGGSSSSSGSSSQVLANTGINTATGVSLLVGGASLALVGAELLLIARRKRSN